MEFPGHNNTPLNIAVLCLGLHLSFQPSHQHLVGSHQRQEGLCHGINSSLFVPEMCQEFQKNIPSFFCYGPRNQDSQTPMTNFIIIVFFFSFSNNSCSTAYSPEVMSNFKGSPQFICSTFPFYNFCNLLINLQKERRK